MDDVNKSLLRLGLRNLQWGREALNNFNFTAARTYLSQSDIYLARLALKEEMNGPVPDIKLDVKINER